MSERSEGIFDDMDGKFDARLRRVFSSTKTAKNGDQEIVVTNIVATVEARFDFRTLERLYSPNFVAIERHGKGEGNYLIFEVVGVNPMHFQMLGMDVSMPTLLRREYLDTISESWGKSQETWIDMGAIPTWYSMTVEGGKATFEKCRVLPLAGAKVYLLSRKTVEEFLCVPNGEVVGTMLGFELPLTVSLDNLIRYHAGLFGFSVAPSEPIVYREGGKIKITEIAELVDKHYRDSEEGPVYTSGIEVVCFDRETLKVKWAPLQYVFRHRYDKNLLKFRLRTGREVTVTPSHSLFVAREGTVISIPASQIVVGDHVVGAREIPVEREENASLDLLSLVRGDSKGIRLIGIPSNEIPRGFAPGSGKTTEWRWRKRGMILVDCASLLSAPALRGARIAYKGFAQGLPLQLEVDEAMAGLMGYYAAEGHVATVPGEKYDVQFTLGEKDVDIVRELEEMASHLGMKSVMRAHGAHGLRLTISNRLLARILSELVGRGARKKRVPQTILNSPLCVRRAFLRAWLKGDFGVTSSPKLMNDVMYLFLMEGCAATSTLWKSDTPVYIEGRRIKAGIHYQLKFPVPQEYVSGKFRTERTRAEPTYPAMKLPSDLKQLHAHPSHLSRVKLRVNQRMIDDLDSALRRLLAYDGAEAKGSNETRHDGYYRTNMGKYLVRNGNKTHATTLLQSLPNQLADARKLAESNLGFFEVQQIEEIESRDQFVYDVSVPESENFLSGFGGVFCHNTGSGKSNLTSILLRKVMRSSPDVTTIVFDVSGEYATHLIDLLEEDGRIISYETLDDAQQLYNSQVIPESLEGTVSDEAIRGIFSGLLEKKLVQKMSSGTGTSALDLAALEQLLTSTAEDGKSGAVAARIGLERLTLRFFRELKLQRSTKLAELDDAAKGELLTLIDGIKGKVNDRTSLFSELSAIAEYIEAPAGGGDGEGEGDELTPERLAWQIVKEEAPRLNVLYLPDPKEARMVASRLINRLLYLRKKQGSRKKILIVLDEAQEYIPGEPRERDGTIQSNIAVEALLRQGRKYRIHCWLATQRVARLNVSALQQLHSYFVSTLPRFYDRMVISESFALPLEVLERTAQLDTGEWIFVSYKATKRKNVPVFLRTEDNEKVIAAFLKGR